MTTKSKKAVSGKKATMVPLKQVRSLVASEVKKATKQTKEFLAAAMSDALTPGEDMQWRRLTGDAGRDLPAVTQDRMIELSYWLWKTNPLARFIIEIQTAFVVGDGIKLKSDNEKVQALLDEFWTHPVNNMELNAEKHVRELGMFGEQCWPKFVGYYSGNVALGYQDPAYIKTVVTDPENCKIIIGVITRGKDFHDGKKYKTALDPRVDEFLSPDARSFRESCEDRECYFFAINNVTNAPRGTSDLFHRADWLDMYEQFLFDYAEKIAQFNTFIWDLMVDGDDKVIDAIMKKLSKKSGSTFGHNKSVTLEAKSPDLKSADQETSSRLFRNHILGEVPEHWFGGGGDVNRAAAMEMGTPVFKMMSSRQRYVCSMLSFVGNDIIREADKRGFLAGVPDDEKKCRAEAPEMVTKDMTKFGSVIQSLATSLVSMTQSEMLSKDTAIKTFAFALELIGYRLDPEAEKTAIEEEMDAAAERDYKIKPSPKVGEEGPESRGVGAGFKPARTEPTA